MCGCRTQHNRKTLRHHRSRRCAPQRRQKNHIATCQMSTDTANTMVAVRNPVHPGTFLLLLLSFVSCARGETRQEPLIARIFLRSPNGCWHRHIHMCLFGEFGQRVAAKTVLRIVRRFGLKCQSDGRISGGTIPPFGEIRENPYPTC